MTLSGISAARLWLKSTVSKPVGSLLAFLPIATATAFPLADLDKSTRCRSNSSSMLFAEPVDMFLACESCLFMNAVVSLCVLAKPCDDDPPGPGRFLKEST